MKETVLAPRVVVWFSCGAASAVAAKLSVDAHGAACEVVYCDTFAAEHPDNRRFFDDVQRWLDRKITVIRSVKYESVDAVFEKTRYMSGIAGARCTVEMKKVPREQFQRETDTHVFGYTKGEEGRAALFEKNNPSLCVDWPLIENGIGKQDCVAMLNAAGIAIPAMYGIGFDHNNCLGCVKATSPGYWNRIRNNFPDVFALRVRQSRALGVRLARVHGARVFLDELDRLASAPDDSIECGPVCQVKMPWG